MSGRGRRYRHRRCDQRAGAGAVERGEEPVDPGVEVLDAGGTIVGNPLSCAAGIVALDQVREADEVTPFLAATLGVKEAEDRSWMDGLVALIGSGRALLLLDNLEQVVDAAADIATLVDRCPGLRVVATSRTPLHIRAEREYALAPLARLLRA